MRKYHLRRLEIDGVLGVYFVEVDEKTGAGKPVARIDEAELIRAIKEDHAA